MAKIRNNSQSIRRIRDGNRDYILRPKVDTEIPDAVVDAYKTKPGHAALFARGILVDKRTGARVLRMEGAAVNAAPKGLDDAKADEAPKAKKAAKKKASRKASEPNE